MAPLGHARRAFMTSADPCHTGNWSGAQPGREAVAHHVVALSTYLGHTDIANCLLISGGNARAADRHLG